jgi:deoxyribonuclease-4
LDRAYSLESAAVVVHAGQAVTHDRVKALRRQSRVIKKVLGTSLEGPFLALELTAGGKGAIASRFQEACEVLDICEGHPRLKLCVDTCHLHAAGYDLSNAGGVRETFEELDDQVGIDRLVLIHANDSRDDRGSRRDRHWHIGGGRIGLTGFKALMRYPALRGIPFICETPGALQDDRTNVALLKGLRIASG